MFEKKLTKEEVKIEANKKLFKESLEGFRKEYANLVQKYSIVHGIRWTQPTDLNPQIPFITEVWVKKQIDEAKQKKNVEDSVIVKN